jgi:hypothetical protein
VHENGERALEMAEILDEGGIESAADSFWKEGSHHGWWSDTRPTWRDLDPIGKEEFLAIVERIVVAYLRARA